MVNRLKEMLAFRGMSVSELSRLSGVSQPTLDRIVNGKVNIEAVNAKNFLRIAHGLGLSAEQLCFCDMSYDARKRLIDRAYAQTTPEGRHALLAAAVGVMRLYPPETPFMPAIADADGSPRDIEQTLPY